MSDTFVDSTLSNVHRTIIVFLVFDGTALALACSISASLLSVANWEEELVDGIS
jgi:hypothetical protein